MTPIRLALLLALAPAAAQAHAILVDSTPPIDATLAAAPPAITLRFNSRIDRARSRLTLITPGLANGSNRATPAIDKSGPDDILHATLPPLPPGRHVLRWQVLAIDGHITRGDVPFTVAPPPASGPASVSR